MPSFLQIVVGVCICYLIVRGCFAPTLKLVKYNLPEVLSASSASSGSTSSSSSSVPPNIHASADTDDENEDLDIDPEEYAGNEPSIFTRQAGLDALEALIDKRPVARTRQDVLDFLIAFKANKNRWGVTQEDLRAMYLRKYNIFFLGKMFAQTMMWVPNYASYLQKEI